MHNEMVEIFNSRMNDKSLIEDDNGTKNISTNRIQSSFQEISAKQLQQQEVNFSTKIASIVQQFDNSKRLKYQNEGNQIDNTQNEKVHSKSYAQNKSTSYYDIDNQKQEQASQLQDQLSISFQNDQKSFANQFQSDQENKWCSNQDQYFNSSDLQLNFTNVITTFRNNNQSSQQDNKNELQQDQNNQMLKKTSSSSKSQAMEIQERTQSVQLSGNNSKQQNWQEHEHIFENSKILSQNQSQLSSRLNEQQNKKQKQSMAFQFGSRKKESRKLTENEKQITQKKYKKTNFIHILMKMRNYAYKMASNVESKRLAILQRQNFFYFRDKTINYEKKQKVDFEFYDYNFFQRIIRFILEQAQSNLTTKRIVKSFPTIPLFQPQSLWKFVWDIFNMIIVILFFFYLPLYFIYDIQFSRVFYVQNLDIVFATITTLDIFINLNTVSYRKGNLLHSRSLILLEYFSKNGLLNLSFVAILWIIVASQRNQLLLIKNYKFSIAFFIVAIFKVFKQNSFKNRIYDRFYLRKVNRGFISLMQIFFNLFIVCHLFACIWLVVGKINQNVESTLCAQQNANNNNNNNCIYTWLDKLKGTHNFAFYEEYLRAYYFTTVTMITVGYGDIVPVNSEEYLLSILTMLIACGMFGYSLNSIGQILSEMQINSKEYDEHFNAIYGFMHKKNISTDLQVQVREYLQYFFIQSNQEDIKKQQKVISLLPDSLQNQIMLDANKIIFENSPLFRTNFSEQIIQRTIKIIEQREFIPGQNIQMQEVESDYSIYFIEKGCVEIYNSNNNEEIKILHKGQQFGEVQFFTGQTSKISIRSIEFTKLLIIKRSSFLEIIQSSPLDLEKFCMIKDSIIFSNKLEMVCLFCYCCKSSSHLVTQCNFIHLQQDKYKIIKDYVKNNIQERDKDIQRRIHSYDSLQLKEEIEENAKLFVEENIDELYYYGWFNDLIQQEFQGNLIQFKQSTGYPSRASLQTINQNQDLQITKTIQNQQNQFTNKKIQYQKIKNIIDNQRVSSYPELNPSVVNGQQESYISFQNANQLYNEEYSQNPQAATYNINKKVQFSIHSLQENIQEDNSCDCKSLYNNQCQFSQFIKQQSHPNNYHYNSINGAEFNNLSTPTNRQRQLSNFSEVSLSPYSANNFQVNLNSANYYHPYQNNLQSNLNNYSVNNNQVFQYSQQSNYNIPEIVNQYASQESSRQLSNYDTYSQQVKRNSNEDSNLYAKFMNQPKQSSNLHNQIQKQQDFTYSRNNKKKNTLKTEHTNKRKSINPLQMNIQLSSVFQRQTNEALIKQLKELVQIPQNLATNQDYQFDVLKNYSIYMPQNNSERVLLLYSVFMRKNQPILSVYKTKKSINKDEDSQSNIKSKKQNICEDSRKSIQYYKNLLKQNQEENNFKEEYQSSQHNN